MSIYIQPMTILTQRAKHALIQELGVVDTMRFLNQFRAGSGNYTQERQQLFKELSTKDIIADIKARRTKPA